MLAALYPTKKALKEAIGTELRYEETSVFGKDEYSSTGTFAVVGPTATFRKWYASVTVKGDIITEVK